MATYNKFQQFVEDLCFGVHDLENETTAALTLALSTNANAPSLSLDAVLGDFTEIAYTNLSTRILANVVGAHTTGTFKLDADDHVLTASAAVATFRHITIYNDTPSTPLNPLIATFDHGSDVTLATSETHTTTFNAGGIFTLV